MMRSSTCSTRWCGSAPSGVKRPQNSYLPGRSTSACSASHTRSAAGSVSASYTTFGGAGTTARKRRSGSVIGISLRIAGDGQAERVALGTAVAGEQVLQRLLQLVEERLALLRAHPDIPGHADRGQVGLGEVERGDVRLHVLHKVDQVAQAELVAGLTQPDPAHQAWRQPVGPAGRLVDPLVDPAHPALGHLTDQAGLQQALYVVVDPLRGLVELDRHLGARPGLGELPQHFDPLRLEQDLSLLDLVQVDDVPHDENQSLRKRTFCQWSLARLGVPLSAWLTLAARPSLLRHDLKQHALALLDPGGQPPGQVDAGNRAARVAGKEAALARVLAVGDDVLVAGEQADVERRG